MHAYLSHAGSGHRLYLAFNVQDFTNVVPFLSYSSFNCKYSHLELRFLMMYV